MELAVYNRSQTLGHVSFLTHELLTTSLSPGRAAALSHAVLPSPPLCPSPAHPPNPLSLP